MVFGRTRQVLNNRLLEWTPHVRFDARQVALMNPFPRQIASLMLPLACCFAVAHAAELPLQAALSKLAPNANPKVFALALAAIQCAEAQGQPPSDRLAVIDYSKPSTVRRLWVFNLIKRKLLYYELVAHGRNTGGNLATTFSNTLGSLQSSLGLFRTLGTYIGHNGYSLRMQGLEPGINDHALERALVIHGASYVNPALARQQGRIGRSYGCPAVRNAIARPLIDKLKGGQYVFSYYPDARWLKTSPYLKCSSGRAMVASLYTPETPVPRHDVAAPSFHMARKKTESEPEVSTMFTYQNAQLIH